MSEPVGVWPCCCTASGYVCKMHREDNETLSRMNRDVAVNPPIVSASEQFRREAVRIAQQTPAPLTPTGVATVEQQRVRIQELTKEMEAQRAVLYDLVAERNRIAYVLRTFYFAQLSLSTIQPLLALACELNPEIVEQRR